MTTTSKTTTNQTTAGGSAVAVKGAGRPADAPRLPRGRRTVAAVVVATVVLLLAAFAGWQAVLIQTGRQPSPLDAAAISARLNTTPWTDPALVITGAVLAVLGLWLVLLAITPARRTMVELTEDHPDVATGIRPGDLRRALTTAAEGIDGVSTASTSTSGSTATVTVSSPLGDPTGLTDRVTDRLAGLLGQLAPVNPLTPRVKLAGKDRR